MTSSLHRWQSALPSADVIDFFAGLFDAPGVRVTDTGEAFTCYHRRDRIEFADGIDEGNVDFVVEIDAAQVDRMVEDARPGGLDERARFRIMAELATPATQAVLARPMIRSRLLRSILFKVGRAESLMHVVLAAPAGEEEVAHTIAYVDGQWLVIPGRHGRVTHLYRLTVADAVEYQRRMLAARKANRPATWLAFARWYGRLRRRVLVSG